MSITWSDVEALAPTLSEVSVEAQAIILAHVARVVGANRWGDHVDMGQTLLAAHFGKLALDAANGSSGVGQVQSETVGPLSKTYSVIATGTSSGALGSTSWGLEYDALRAILTTRFGLVI